MASLSISRLLCSLFVFAVALHVGTTARAVTFADGLVHVIDASNSYPLESVTVLDGPGDSTTRVNLVPGGQVATSGGGALVARERSVVDVSGGTIGGFLSYTDSSSGAISGGTMNSLHLHQSASAVLSGGTMQYIETNHSSSLTILGGSYPEAIAEDSSSILIHDVSITFAAAAGGSATVEIRDAGTELPNCLPRPRA